MKKKLLLLAFVPMLFFTSCESEEVVNEKGIVGKWYFYVSIYEEEEAFIHTIGPYAYVFEKSGNGRGEVFNLNIVEFTYSLKGSKLYITPKEGGILGLWNQIGEEDDDLFDGTPSVFDIVSLTKSKLVLRHCDDEEDTIITLYSTEKEAKANPEVG